jgi:hypothetical protein
MCVGGYEMRITFAATTVALSLSAQAFAQGPPSYGFGAGPCSTYLSDLRLRGEQGRVLYYSWAQGFITAANALLSTEHPMVKTLTATISDDEQQKVLDSMCRSKPEQDFSRAAMQLLDKIREADGLQPILK